MIEAREIRPRSRRLFILRFLVEMDGTANESEIFTAVAAGVSPQTTQDDIRRDLDHLRERRCITEDLYDGKFAVVTTTERGEHVAYGRVEVEGVEHSRWNRS